MSLFSEAMANGFSALSDMAEEPITYIYDAVQTEIVGIAGQERGELTPTGGRTQITNRTVDWLIHKDLLENEPKRGNTIIREDGRKYKVAAVGGGPCWRWSDGHETYYRIQTVKTV